MPTDNTDKNYTLLFKAAANGADNSLSKTANRLIMNEKEDIEASAKLNGNNLSEEEAIAKARKKIIEQYSSSENLRSDNNQELGLGDVMGFVSNPLGSIIGHLGGRIFATLKEKFIDGSKEDLSAIWKRKGEEIEINKFAEVNKIDSKSLLSELRNLPTGTEQAAAITPEDHATRIAKAKEQVKGEETGNAKALAKENNEIAKERAKEAAKQERKDRISEAAETAAAIERAKHNELRRLAEQDRLESIRIAEEEKRKTEKIRVNGAGNDDNKISAATDIPDPSVTKRPMDTVTNVQTSNQNR